jgi:hypothetical protein
MLDEVRSGKDQVRELRACEVHLVLLARQRLRERHQPYALRQCDIFGHEEDATPPVIGWGRVHDDIYIADRCTRARADDAVESGVAPAREKPASGLEFDAARPLPA